MHLFVGVAPPRSTNYHMDDSAQVVVAKTAAERGSIQPVVTLTANGKERADVKVGQPVTLNAAILPCPSAASVK